MFCGNIGYNTHMGSTDNDDLKEKCIIFIPNSYSIHRY